MIKYLTHYYKKESTPFQSISKLPKKKAIQIMNKLYEDNAMWGRFKNPEQYLQERKKTELWLRKEFKSKGGCPQEKYPIYMIVEECNAIEKNMKEENIEKIKIPISHFNEKVVSFTYIDSMFSYRLAQDESSEYYKPKYHGKVFTLSEIFSMIKNKGLPTNKEWWGDLPDDFLPYIEAQVWNHKLVRKYIN